MSETRKIAAILASDVVGYSRLTSVDEDRTLARLRALRSDLIDPTIAVHHGRVVKRTGDGSIVEFRSVVDAVRCAIEVQNGMVERNAGVPAERRIDFRIGIHLGDIVEESDGDLMGDGVNIAARLEGIAKPGMIVLSEDAYRQVKGRLSLAVNDLGVTQLKNIAEPIRIYSLDVGVAPQVRAATQIKPTTLPETSSIQLALPDKPSIAVLPFNNMSGDPEQDYFADGMAEDILTALSRCSWLFVIARNSSFTYKGRSVDIRQVGRELGVRYVLEGSVRRGGDRLRITGQLIEANSGSHVWADRFDGEISDVFALQDRITESVVGAIEPMLQLAEIERLKRKSATNFDAYDLVLRAQQLEYEFTEASLSEALQCLKQALAIDSSYAPAVALAAYCYAERAYQGWTKEAKADAAEGISLAMRAVEIGKDDPNVLWMAAFAVWQLGRDSQGARELFSRSLLVNPNSAVALSILGWIEGFLGEYDKAVDLISRAQRLSPRDPRGWMMSVGMALTNLVAGKFADSAIWAEKALLQNPRSATALRVFAVSLANLGQLDRAANVVQKILQIDPGLTINGLKARVPLVTDSVWKIYSEGLRLAGLPE